MKVLHQEQSKIEHKGNFWINAGELELIPQILEVRKTDGLYVYIY
jgi:hypothetical protein